MIQPVRVVIWLVEGTWRGCIDAAAASIPSGARVALLHVTPSDVTEVAEAAAGGLLGRAFPRRTPPQQFQEVTEEAAAELLSAAAARLGRQDVELLHRQGRVEREVVLAVAQDVDLLVAARDGDRSHLGPRSLGPTTRFVVDHAPCAVLLVWPDQPPGVESIPPPPHENRPRRGPG
jgi:nucleotide-binding universal stress UspA family protein